MFEHSLFSVLYKSRSEIKFFSQNYIYVATSRQPQKAVKPTMNKILYTQTITGY